MSFSPPLGLRDFFSVYLKSCQFGVSTINVQRSGIAVTEDKFFFLVRRKFIDQTSNKVIKNMSIVWGIESIIARTKSKWKETKTL